ncbi:hypothetical protein SynNOUM97013_02571 [Synechococcus sp. NOUM97013]|nr:hypothetical protein SynNOUM97013_02571 [Synechococcus sp. NOUM97013]
MLLCFGLLRVFFWLPVYCLFASPMSPARKPMLNQIQLMDRH